MCLQSHSIRLSHDMRHCGIPHKDWGNWTMCQRSCHLSSGHFLCIDYHHCMTMYCHLSRLSCSYYDISKKHIDVYLTEFAKTWLKKLQVHFNNLTSKSNGKQWKVTSQGSTITALLLATDGNFFLAEVTRFCDEINEFETSGKYNFLVSKNHEAHS